jgi:hypothetical protein
MTSAALVEEIVARVVDVLRPELAALRQLMERGAPAADGDAGPLLTRDQLREALQTSESTLKRWDRQGCPRVDIGERSPRYRLHAVIAWRKAQTEQRKASAPVAVGIRPLSRRRR